MDIDMEIIDININLNQIITNHFFNISGVRSFTNEFHQDNFLKFIIITPRAQN